MKHVAMGGGVLVGLVFFPHVLLAGAAVYTVGAGVAAFAKAGDRAKA